MSASHTTQDAPVASTALETLRAFLEERRRSKTPVPKFEEFESQLHTLVAAVECEALGEELERFDVDVPVIVIGGVAYRRVVRCGETYFAPAGEVRVVRSLYATGQSRARQQCAPWSCVPGSSTGSGRPAPRSMRYGSWRR